MSNKMLVDAAHPEETRVVVLRGNKVEEFDFEAAERQQLRGNIYLAKVTRVEPSLQAAFVDYGGNRHGFLAFSEIHPDYYQIPVADRQALVAEQAREDAEQAARENRDDDDKSSSDDDESADAGVDGSVDPEDNGESTPVESNSSDATADEQVTIAEDAGLSGGDQVSAKPASDDAGAGDEGDVKSASDDPASERNGEDNFNEDSDDENGEDDAVEEVGSTDAMEEMPVRRKPRPRQYKIQEVIKRRQVLLVQVVKEERGNKGAALTTYLSLAGRYSVLMPNTARGGGISRKITSPTDRKRLKSVAGELEVAEGMGVILRTAGASRTKAEIKRDFEYLLRLWENVRELTLKSSAPALVYEEGSLIKRSIRDLYSKEIDQVLVSGDEGYRDAKDFMRMLMPSHARNVQQYKDSVPLFARHGVENQLDAMFSAQVTLKSGGYLVINQTEALVAIDVNSGRSTREHSIEDTALKTNLQAAEEASRQMRLRDLAGLIVIDFIDMEEKRNNRAVEKKLKECLKFDRARIQVGRISHFGLLEMSRQRIRAGVLESSMEVCTTCHGSGQVRSVSSLTLQILRALDDHLMRHPGHNVTVRTRPDVALYILNQKRANLSDLERRFGISLTISEVPPENGAGFQIEKGEASNRPAEVSSAIAMSDMAEMPEMEDDPVAGEAADERSTSDTEGTGEDRKRRRRRRRRGSGGENTEASAAVEALADSAEAPSDESGAKAGEAEDGEGQANSDGDGEQTGRKRRRGRRGGRRRGRGREGSAAASADANGEPTEETSETVNGAPVTEAKETNGAAGDS
ncbi:MAG: Rne/Rng family ribonuclease, partial [Alphaproteobacteria bacterium]